MRKSKQRTLINFPKCDSEWQNFHNGVKLGTLVFIQWCAFNCRLFLSYYYLLPKLYLHIGREFKSIYQEFENKLRATLKKHINLRLAIYLTLLFSRRGASLQNGTATLKRTNCIVSSIFAINHTTLRLAGSAEFPSRVSVAIRQKTRRRFCFNHADTVAVSSDEEKS